MTLYVKIYPIFKTDHSQHQEHKQKILAVLEDFKKENGDYPTTLEITTLKRDHLGLIPDARTIQAYGGIRKFYEDLGLAYVDARTGNRRGDTAYLANLRSQKDEKSLYNILVKKFGEVSVHRNPPYKAGIESLHKADFKIYHKDSFFFVDIFNASHTNSFSGCVNAKIKKIEKIYVSTKYPIYFVSASENISQFDVDNLVNNRKTFLPTNLTICTLPKFLSLLDQMA